MILHLRIEDGALVSTTEVIEWATQVMHSYSATADVLDEGVHDVTPSSFEGGPNRHRVRVLPDGTAVYGVYRGEELQKPLLSSSESDQKTVAISPSSPVLTIALNTRTPDMIFVLAIIFYRADLEDFRPDLSRIGRN